MRIKDPFKLVLSIAVCQMAGIVGSFFTSPAIPTWYASLQKPAFTPPSWVFAPVWVTLFTLMGISLYLVWTGGLDKKGVKTALSLFGIQLLLNALWSFLFFGLKNPFYAFIEIIFLWILIALTTAKFYGVSKRAAYPMVPYLLWVTFAAILNFHVWMLNG
jgi:benzodiazapine receptor